MPRAGAVHHITVIPVTVIPDVGGKRQIFWLLELLI
jgi:hypothetical protein